MGLVIWRIYLFLYRFIAPPPQPPPPGSCETLSENGIERIDFSQKSEDRFLDSWDVLSGNCRRKGKEQLVDRNIGIWVPFVSTEMCSLQESFPPFLHFKQFAYVIHILIVKFPTHLVLAQNVLGRRRMKRNFRVLK